MPDKTYDVVIVGGGNAGLVLGMYLTKYGGLDTVILEERNELGGSWETIENALPGVPVSTHSFIHCLRLYRVFTPVDFPEFDEYGGKLLPHNGISVATVFIEDHTASGYYNISIDPTGERSATALLARYSERDAELWVNFCELLNTCLYDYFEEMLCTVPDPRKGTLEAVIGKVFSDPRVLKVLDPQIMYSTPLQTAQIMFEAPENQQMPLRAAYSAGLGPLAAGSGIMTLLIGISAFRCAAFIKGGAHSLAHAAQRIIKENGGEYFTRSRVDALIIENDAVKGVRLADGTEIGARKAVVTAGLSPMQLLDLLGRDRVSPIIRRKIDNLLLESCLIYWSWFIFGEKPHYKACEVMGEPLIDTAYWVCPANKDVYALAKQDAMRKYPTGLGMPPPYPSERPPLNLACIHSGELGDGKLDPTLHPGGKFAQLVEQHDIHPFLRDERWWIQHHEDMRKAVIDVMHEFAPNITEDSLLGYAPLSPWTITRLRNYQPYGNMLGLDHDLAQQGSTRPILEWSGYKVPWIKGLYCTGTCWWGGGFAGDTKGYNCYKVMADDLGLRKVWEEKGRPY